MLGGGGDEVSIMPVVYPLGTVSFSSIGYFSSVGSSSKPSHPSVPLSLSEYTLFKIISIRRGGGSENTSSHKRGMPGASSR